MHHCTICSESLNVICHVCTRSSSEQISRKSGFGYNCVMYELPISTAHKVMIVTNVWSTMWKIMVRPHLLQAASFHHKHCLAIHNWLDTLLKVGSFSFFAIPCAALPHVETNPSLIFLLIFFCFTFWFIFILYFPTFFSLRPLKSPPPPMCAEDHGKSLAISVICHALWWTVLISRSSVYGRCQAKRVVAVSAYTST